MHAEPSGRVTVLPDLLHLLVAAARGKEAFVLNRVPGQAVIDGCEAFDILLSPAERLDRAVDHVKGGEASDDAADQGHAGEDEPDEGDNLHVHGGSVGAMHAQNA